MDKLQSSIASMSTASLLKEAAQELIEAVNGLQFAAPVAYVYNPLQYAWKPHSVYIDRYGNSKKKAIFIGMNPGPWGMSQTGVPFGEIPSVRDWMGIEEDVDIPFPEHPKRPVLGFRCDKSEVSGRRLWGYFAERFGKAESFFEDYFVLNFCPLVFMEESSRNRTPDKLPAAEVEALFEACNTHLRKCVEALEPEWIVGVGAFARKRAELALEGYEIKFGQVLHPSPASPAANKGWAEAAEKQLVSQGIFE